MCILCVVQRWSRCVATMLPWLVLPLIFLWAFSQLLPPGYRFEVTSPRLACVSVLLLTLFWYEILLPQLSMWRARRSARLREARRAQALELQKLRKMATRRCRNCNNPYRDQNPGGGRFMCSYCGHISKRPVLDLPGPVSPVVKSGWICSQDWPAAEGNGSWAGARYWLDDRCSAEKSYSGFVVFSWRLFSCLFVSVRWLCRKVFRFGSSREDGSSDEEHKRSLKRGENGGNSHESRGEKARRKAEEKRLARLEKEMLEEEERKQREEVARLVEERRKLRDEKAEAEERSKGATPVGEKETRKEAERRRQERKKEKDKGSSKSNSDCEELDRRASKDKRNFDRKSDMERRDSLRGSSENYKSYNLEANHGSKSTQSKTKYFGRMTNSLLSSSRGFTGASFFGRSAQGPVPSISKVTKPIVGMVDQSNAIKRDAQPAVQTMAQPTSVGENRNSWTNFHRPVSSDAQQRPTGLKKSWHQLFTRSASVSPCPDIASSTCEKKGQPEPHSAYLTDRVLTPIYPNNQPSFGQPMPFPVFPPSNGSLNNTSLSHFPAGPVPFIKGPEPILTEEPELFEDPCYDPDAIALLGPVSESLDNFPLDLGSGFVSSDATNEPHVPKSRSASKEESKPSPIESPLSRSRFSEEKHPKFSQLSCPSKAKELLGSSLAESIDEEGAWHMWKTPVPVVQHSLGLSGGHSGWFQPTANQFNHGVDEQNGGTYNHLGNDSNLWVQNAPFQPLPVDSESLFPPLKLMENTARKDMAFGSPDKSACSHPFEPPGHCWSQEEWAFDGHQESGKSYPPIGPHGAGGLFSTNTDVQPWSFNQKDTA